MLVDTCMAAWNLAHRGKSGRLLDTLLSVGLVGLGLCLLLNVALPELMHWNDPQSARDNRLPAVEAAASAPQVQLSQVPATPDVTPTPQATVASSSRCTASSNNTTAKRKNQSDRQQKKADDDAQASQLAHNAAIPDIVPTVVNAANDAIAAAEANATKKPEHSMPGIGPLPGESDKTDGDDDWLPLKIPTPFPQPWHDKGNDAANMSVLTPTPEPSRLTPAAIPMPRQRTANTPEC